MANQSIVVNLHKQQQMLSGMNQQQIPNMQPLNSDNQVFGYNMRGKNNLSPPPNPNFARLPSEAGMNHQNSFNPSMHTISNDFLNQSVSNPDMMAHI